MDLLAAMRIYTRVVDRGGMSAAAQDLGIGQPAVSERIETLERHLGVRLLSRSTRSLACTSEGLVFYEKSKEAIHAADEACAAVRTREDDLQGVVRIAAPQCLGEVTLPPMLLRLAQRYPALRIDLRLNDRVVDPVTEGVDISLRLGEPGEGAFYLHRLGEMSRILVAAPTYLARSEAITKLDDIGRHPFICVARLSRDGCLSFRGADQSMARVPIHPRIVTSHWRPMYELLLAGTGIGVVQQPAGMDALSDGRLIRLLPGYEISSIQLNALVPRLQPLPTRTRGVLAFFQEQMKEVFGGAVVA